MKYDAFISYRHTPTDTEVSELLHKKLETLRIPGTIQKSSGKKRIERVFRDQEELTVSSSLSAEIISALDNSEFLIVVCSPRTPESEWVNNEVRYFIEKHGRDRILPVLIEGEPETSFPMPLLFEEKRIIDVNGNEYVFEQQSEPLAADFRAGTRKERVKLIDREIFRLVAPILGCKFDDLRQRHRERRNRRVAFILLALFSVVVAFGGYNFWQNQRILESYREQLINQSMFLSDTSLRLLEQGDRTKSILIALEALPEDPENPDRPIVGKAEYALTQALQIYQNHGNLIPDYSIELDDLSSEKILCSESDKIFAVMDRRGSVYIRELDTGEAIAKKRAPDVDGRGDLYLDFQILSDDRVMCYGKYSIACLDGETGVLLWERYLRDLLKEEEYDQYEASEFAVSGDESSLAITFLGNSSIVVLSTTDGTEVYRPSIIDPESYVHRLALSHDGSKIAYAYQADPFLSDDVEIVVIDTKTSEIINRIQNPYANCHSLLFLDDKSLLFGTNDPYDVKDTPGYQDGSLFLYDIVSDQLMWSFDYFTQALSVTTPTVDLHPIHSDTYGDRILFVADEKIMLLDPVDGTCVLEFVAPFDIAGIHFGEESGTCVYANVQGQVRWVNLYNGTEYSFADFSVDNSFFSVTGGGDFVLFIPMESQNVLVYSVYDDPDYRASTNLKEIDGIGYIDELSVSLDGRFSIVRSMNNNSPEGDAIERAYIHEIESGSLVNTVEFFSSVKETIIMPNAILFASEDGLFTRYDFEENKIDTKQVLNQSSYSYMASENSKMVAAYNEKDLFVVDTESLEVVYIYQHEQTVQLFFMAPDGEYLLIQDEDGLCSVHLSSNTAIPFEEKTLSLNAMRSAVFSEKNSTVAIPGFDQRIHIIDLVTGETLSYIDAMADGTFTGCYVQNDTVLIFQSDDGRIRAADVSTGKLIYSGDQVMHYITAWIPCKEKNTLAAFSENDRAILLSMDTEIQPIASIQGFVGFLDRGKGLIVMQNDVLGFYPYRDLKELLAIAHHAVMGSELSEANRVKYYTD